VLYIDGLDGLEHQDQARLRGALAALLPEGAQEVRLIGATQRPLPALTQEGGFRRDLLDAFNVIAIRMPPLRERPADIADLAHAFLVRARREGLSQCTLDAGAIEALKQHAWPGNVRELENLLRRIAALWPEPVITAAKIDQELSAPRISAPAAPAGQAESLDAAIAQHVADTFAAARGSPPEGLYDQMLERLERPLIAETLKATRGNQIKAAAVLGINRNTLRKKIAALGLLTGRGD
jgi:two-component system nitrogen regulation response regulator GlnG